MTLNLVVIVEFFFFIYIKITRIIMVDFKVRTLKVIYKKYGYNMIGTKNALCN